MRFFFYGTLLDPDVRALVLPHCAARLDLQPATLRGWARVQARHGTFPVVRRTPRGCVEGLLVEGLDRGGLCRMAHFEGNGYTVGPLPVLAEGRGAVRANVFLPEHRAFCLTRGWSLLDWQRRHKRYFLPHVRRWMQEFGASGPWSGDLSWHARRRIIAIAAEGGKEWPADSLRLAA